MAEYVDRKEDIISDLIACKAAFTQADIPWVIVGGIVLGYARYKEIMPWDTDLDIVISTELTDERWFILHKALAKQGFVLPRKRLDFMYCHRKTEFNLELYHRDGSFFNCLPKSTPGLKFVEKAEWYVKPQIVNFLDSEYPMPNNIEDFVANHYGADWKTNIIKKHEDYFMQKRGGRDQSVWLTSRAGKQGDLWPKILEVTDNMEVV